MEENPYKPPKTFSEEPNAPNTSSYGRSIKDVGISNVVGLILTLLALAVLIPGVLKLLEIYKAYHLALPGITILVANVWTIAGLGGGFIVWFVCGVFARPKKRSEAIGNLGIICWLIAVVVVIYALFIPFFIMSSFGSPPGFFQ